ncbi:MAG TPA: DinB family protein [Blastocatellia bacterium]
MLERFVTARVFEYSSLDGGRFRNSVEDILTQLFGHSLYHRGQIALLLRSIEAEPAATDFVYWSREAIQD